MLSSRLIDFLTKKIYKKNWNISKLYHNFSSSVYIYLITGKQDCISFNTKQEHINLETGRSWNFPFLLPFVFEIRVSNVFLSFDFSAPGLANRQMREPRTPFLSSSRWSLVLTPHEFVRSDGSKKKRTVFAVQRICVWDLTMRYYLLLSSIRLCTFHCL